MIVYRQATPADVPAILDLLREIMSHHGVAPPDPRRLAAAVSGIISSSDHCFLIADAEGGVIGMCALLFSISTWSASPVCELQDVVVTASHRREDVGRGLINAAERVARARNCTRLFLLAEGWNLGAHAFYRNLGMDEKTCLYFERDLSAPA
jgi:N-acetylglutamate synthase-like GNAT family acetyltransferase